MKLTMLALTLLFSMSIYACPGGQTVQLNDIKVLTAYSVKDTAKNIDYMFADDLEGQPLGASYSISDSKGQKTHQITLIHGQNNKVEVVIVDLLTNQIRFFKGQYGMMRGCNDIIEYQPETEEI